jgi:hypothetical protein
MTATAPGDRRWSAQAPSMGNFGTGVDKRRWGAVELRARPGRRRKGVRGKENGRRLRSALFEALQWHGAVGGSGTGGAGARWRGRGRDPGGLQRPGAADAGTGLAACEQGRGRYGKEAAACGPRWL